MNEKYCAWCGEKKTAAVQGIETSEGWVCSVYCLFRLCPDKICRPE